MFDRSPLVKEAPVAVEDDRGLTRATLGGWEAIELWLVAGLHRAVLALRGLTELKHPEDLAATRRYYDEFSRRYDTERGGRVADGYHDLIDDLEIDFLRRFAAGRDVLEVGCGTGLLLERIGGFATRAYGIDLSPGMLAGARTRGLDVGEASATALPFDDESFDVTCSFKVLAHIAEIRTALEEMTRVTRRGGTIVAEFYNPRSLRALAKRFAPPGKIGEQTTEAEVYTRFDTPLEAASHMPSNTHLVARRGIRIVTPAAGALRLPLLGRALRRAEWTLCDSPLAGVAGFWIGAFRKD
jgi:ubiquinone/menaquinone biosynthesis C-methylase UbiE